MQTATVRVKLDTAPAERDLDRFESERSKQRARRDERRKQEDERRDRRKREQGGRRTGVVAGAVAAGGRGRRVLFQALAVVAGVEAAEILASQFAGVVRPVSDTVADKLDALAREFQSFKREVTSSFAAFATAGDLARAQELLGGGAVREDVVAEFVRQREIQKALRGVEDAQKRVGREVTGAALRDIVGDTLGKILGMGAQK